MRLKTIKLAGFKSFVDPTTINLPSQLIGIVGPNGCGKSNVIDAVRWVLGESSAKHLRGASLEDVIFNGSTVRKPVGHATIELIFDNSDGTLGGQYAQYSEISIKRHLSRDGQSVYYLNGGRCRRRDITDIFLGTGLGPRSYAIIEQGTVTRLIEAKPEELRVFLEEAAGISKYKERRRETESRIRATRENISRLEDLLAELNKRLETLQRQAKTAEKYKQAKQEERLLKAQLLALRWDLLKAEADEQNRGIATQETAIEAQRAALRTVETEIEKQRDRHNELNETFNQVQGRFYGVGGEIARLETAIQHATEKLQKNRHDLQEVEQAWREAQTHLEQDAGQIESLQHSLQDSAPELEQARAAEERSVAALSEVEQQMQIWQSEWDAFNARAAAQIQAAEVERTRIQHLEEQLLQRHERQQRLTEERALLDSQADDDAVADMERQEAVLKEEMDQSQETLDQLLGKIAGQREANSRLAEEVKQARRQLQEVQRRHATLEALQQAALGKQAGAVNRWLEGQGLADSKRLAESLQVESGWERAVETVLGPYLEAVCVDDLEEVATQVDSLAAGSLTVFDTRSEGAALPATPVTPLARLVSAPWNLSGMLAGIYAVETLSEALALRSRLSRGESIVTLQGIWLGKDWLRVVRPEDKDAGILLRAQELAATTQALEAGTRQLAGLEQQLQDGADLVRALEEQREQMQLNLRGLSQQHAELRTRLSSHRARMEQLRVRGEAIQKELGEINEQLAHDQDELAAARGRLEQVLSETGHHETQRNQLLTGRDSLRQTLEQRREQARNDRDRAREIALRTESMRTHLQSLQVGYERMAQQLSHLSRQREELHQALAQGDDPVNDMKNELEQLLSQRLEIETGLKDARQQVESCDHQLRQLTAQRNEIEQRLQEMRSQLEQQRFACQEVQVRRQTIEEQFGETRHTLATVLEEMPSEARETEWHQRLENLAQRIQRMGNINLAAIDEFAEQSERKEYLDSQLSDLNEALATLESAIRKIDGETRLRFKETYDHVNERLQALYPRLFGGGLARLEMTSDDLLESGVVIVAQPPGKRNGSIHLLSGGEKALTAIALVFALFELNPAPFCMLDEVDAPLDDANAARFCQLVKEMSQQVQFIVISHNKISMEMSHQLIGVTMHEPGASHLVAVDIDEAVAMVAV